MRPSIVIVLVCALAACGGSPEETQTEGRPRVRVQVTAVRRGDISATLQAPGEIEALQLVRLGSPVGGRITQLALRPGDRANTGDVVARVVPLETEAALHGFAILENAGQLGQHERERRRGLEGEQAGVPVRAPFDAVVSDRLRNPGEQVAAGDVLLELFDPTTVDVLAQVPLSEGRRIRPGLHVTILQDGVALEGRVAALVPAVTQPALTLGVRITFASAPARAVLRAPVRCDVELATHTDVPLVPRSAVLSLDSTGHGSVMVAADGLATTRAVRVGLRTDRDAEIAEGLAAGELVVTEGGYGLPDRTAIETAGAGS